MQRPGNLLRGLVLPPGHPELVLTCLKQRLARPAGTLSVFPINQQADERAPSSSVHCQLSGGVMTDAVRVDDKGHVRTIVLNRPDKMNALTHELAWAVVGEIEKVAHDDV